MELQQKTQVKLSDCSLSYVDSRAWKRFGLLALATDLTFERDIASILVIGELVFEFFDRRARSQIPGNEIALSADSPVEARNLIVDFNKVSFYNKNK